jgi:hypothetical protein
MGDCAPIGPPACWPTGWQRRLSATIAWSLGVLKALGDAFPDGVQNKGSMFLSPQALGA